ncbi:sensor histidine kinase [Streptomyces sp. NPDC059134]|uniref:sensor histidine kinase n=1 Tax=Streptomyces sp. NPDC059134 TaxID=3346738 RepID=UPI0036783DB9
MTATRLPSRRTGVPRGARPHRHDGAIAAVGLGCGLVLWGIGLGMHGRQAPLPGAWVLLPLVVLAGTELLRRTAPRTALPVATAALVADQFTTGSVATVVMYTDVMYAAVLYGTPAAARRIPRITVLVTVATTVGFSAWLQTVESLLIGLATGLVTYAPASTGALVRNHRDAAEAARLRARQTALLAEIDRTQAVTAERARMARELHDVVAGHLSAIAIHSTAALSLDDAGTSRDALAVVRENSVAGLAEMRRLIGLLREGDGEREPAPAPTLEALDTLVEQARANGAAGGLGFTLTDRRRPPAAPGPGPGGALPAPVELAAYRIVQEALTNAVKHAAPGTVAVELGLTDHTLDVRVTSPFGDRPGPRAPGAGAGLVGMRERIALLNGVFEAGPVAADDGTGPVWVVRAVLPVGAGGAR